MAKALDTVALRRSPTPDAKGEQVWNFESASPLFNLGPLRGTMAFGGSSLALAVHAAYRTFDHHPSAASLRLYSVLGQFHGPARVDAPLHLRVTSLRDTRSFATRQVVISQPKPKDPSQQQTSCVLMLDFVVKKGKASERTLLSLSQPPQRTVTHHSRLPNHEDFIAAEIQRGFLPNALAKMNKPFWDLLDMFQVRYCPEGVLGQTAGGARSDHADEETRATPIHERHSYDWLRLREVLPVASTSIDANNDMLLPPTATSASAALLAYFLDSWTSVVATYAARLDDGDIESVASLDFALRLHVDDLDATQWHLRQSSVKAAHDERNYVESQLWREQSEIDGSLQLVATLTQTCILRGKDRGIAPKL